MTDDLAAIYRDLHQNPELAFQETRTAGIAAEWLTTLGYEVTSGVGGTGVVGILRNGPGPTVLLRADMDGLPVEEATGLPYASTRPGPDCGRRRRAGHARVRPRHACHVPHGRRPRPGRARDSWSGTVMAVFQPAEEAGAGARGHDQRRSLRALRPPGRRARPARRAAARRGTSACARARPSRQPTPSASSCTGVVPTARGRRRRVDPVVMAAAVVLRLQTVVSREIGGTDVAVRDASVRSTRARPATSSPTEPSSSSTSAPSMPAVRERVLAAVERIIRAEAAASGAPREPEIEVTSSFPAVANDPSAVDADPSRAGCTARRHHRSRSRDRQRGRRPAGDRRQRAVRVLAPRRGRSGAVRGPAGGVGPHGASGGAALEPLAALRTGDRAHARSGGPCPRGCRSHAGWRRRLPRPF